MDQGPNFSAEKLEMALFT